MRLSPCRTPAVVLGCAGKPNAVTTEEAQRHRWEFLRTKQNPSETKAGCVFASDIDFIKVVSSEVDIIYSKEPR